MTTDNSLQAPLRALVNSRNCILCGEMICGCPSCWNSPSVQGIIGICDTDLWAVFEKWATREEDDVQASLSMGDPRVVYLFKLRAELSAERQLEFSF